MTSAMSLRHVRLFGRHFIAIAVIGLPIAGFAVEMTATPSAQAGVGNTPATKSTANPAPATAGNNRIAEWIIATNPKATPASVHTAAADSSPRAQTPVVRDKPAATSTPVASPLTASADAPASAVDTATTAAAATKTAVAPIRTPEALSRKAPASPVVTAKTAVIPARKPVVITQRTTVRTATTVRTPTTARTPTTVKKVVASARKPVAATRKTTTRTLVTTKTRTPAKPAARRPLAASTVVKRRTAPVQKRARAAVRPSLKAPAKLQLAAASALMVDSLTGEAIYLKNADKQMPIASITKLMTAMVVLDSKPDLQATITISAQDVDHLKHTSSRLPVGASLTRGKLLQLALMSSENRAAAALSRAYPGGRPRFIEAMQAKAISLGMNDTRFNDATGLTPANVSTAADLVKMVKAAGTYSLIRQFTTTTDDEVLLASARHPLAYRNTNRLVRGGQWDIALSKTGFINEAGHCLVMLAEVAQREVVMVFLDVPGKLTPVGDATRFKSWMEAGGGGLKLAAATK